MIDYPPHPGPLPLKGAREKRERPLTLKVGREKRKRPLILEVKRKRIDILQQATEYEPIAKNLMKKENA